MSGNVPGAGNTSYGIIIKERTFPEDSIPKDSNTNTGVLVGVGERTAWNIKNNGKIPTNGNLDINEIVGRSVFIVGTLNDGPFCKRTFIQEVGTDNDGDYFKVNTHIEGSNLFFSEEDALKLFEEQKKKYIKTLTNRYKELVEYISLLEADIDTPTVEENGMFGRMGRLFGDEREPSKYNQELKPTIEIGQTVYITRMPGERIGRVNPVTNPGFRIVETEVAGVSVQDYSDGLQLRYELQNGEHFASGRDEFQQLFTDLEKAQKFIEGSRTNFLDAFSGDIVVERDITKEEKKAIEHKRRRKMFKNTHKD